MTSVIHFFDYRYFFYTLFLSFIGIFYGVALPVILSWSHDKTTKKMFHTVSKNIGFIISFLATTSSVYLLFTLQSLPPSASLIPLGIGFVYFCWVHTTKRWIFPLVILLSILLIVYSHYLVYSITVGYFGFIWLSIFPALAFL